MAMKIKLAGRTIEVEQIVVKKLECNECGSVVENTHLRGPRTTKNCRKCGNGTWVIDIKAPGDGTLRLTCTFIGADMRPVPQELAKHEYEIEGA